MSRTPGRRPKPTNLKLLQGNPGRRPTNKNEPKPKTACPRAPSHLDAVAKREWRRIVPELQAMHLLTLVDRAALAAYCQTYSRWAAAEKALQKAGTTLIRTTNGNVIQSPYVGIANTSLKLMHAFLTEFGLTPSSRSRIAVGAPQENPLEAFLDERKR